VVGVNPDTDATAADVRGSRKGRFTAGPQGGQAEGAGDKGSGTGSGLAGTGSGSQGADSAAGVAGSGAAPIRIPNLSIEGAPAAVATVAALSRPDAKDPGLGRDSLLRSVPDAKLEAPPALPGQLPEPPPNLDAPLLGKAVYTLAVNMPNVSSYSGSWVIEFAELNEDKQPGALAPPSPRYKVDPKYVRSAIEEEIEGEVVLHAVIRRDGQVDHIRVMKSLDERLDDSAMAALSKWRFNPATKAGLPVDIETVVRIPFRLAPDEETLR
jgi:TonB family protein